MTMSNSFEAFTYVREDAPFFTIAAIFQKDPQVLIGHPGTGFDGFEDLKGRTLLIGNGGRVTYWPYLRKKYGLRDEQLRPYTFNMAPFLADKNVVQQGFLSSEPYSIAQALGRMPDVLLIADAGFSAYQTTIAISRKMAAEKKDLVQRFVDATLEGWAQYLKGGPAIEAANALIKKHNPDQTDDRIALCDQGAERARHRDVGRRAAGRHRRHERDARWQAFYESMVDVDVLPQGLDVARAYTLDFVNKGIGNHVTGSGGRDMYQVSEEHQMLRDLVKKFVRNELMPLEKNILERFAAGQPAALHRRGERQALQAVQGARPVGARRAGGGGRRQPAGRGAGRRQRGAGLHLRALHLPAGLAQPAHAAGRRPIPSSARNTSSPMPRARPARPSPSPSPAPAAIPPA